MAWALTGWSALRPARKPSCRGSCRRRRGQSRQSRRRRRRRAASAQRRRCCRGCGWRGARACDRAAAPPRERVGERGGGAVAELVGAEEELLEAAEGQQCATARPPSSPSALAERSRWRSACAFGSAAASAAPPSGPSAQPCAVRLPSAGARRTPSASASPPEPGSSPSPALNGSASVVSASSPPAADSSAAHASAVRPQLARRSVRTSDSALVPRRTRRAACRPGAAPSAAARAPPPPSALCDCRRGRGSRTARARAAPARPRGSPPRRAARRTGRRHGWWRHGAPTRGARERRPGLRGDGHAARGGWRRRRQPLAETAALGDATAVALRRDRDAVSYSAELWSYSVRTPGGRR